MTEIKWHVDTLQACSTTGLRKHLFKASILKSKMLFSIPLTTYHWRFMFVTTDVVTTTWVAIFGQLITLTSAFTDRIANTTLASRDTKLWRLGPCPQVEHPQWGRQAQKPLILTGNKCYVIKAMWYVVGRGQRNKARGGGSDNCV